MRRVSHNATSFIFINLECSVEVPRYDEWGRTVVFLKTKEGVPTNYLFLIYRGHIDIDNRKGLTRWETSQGHLHT
jgi:hypothetical protein